ncbi:MAG: hypothetical protein ACC742_10330, partial [Thermoanaerobaculales bacterium]
MKRILQLCVVLALGLAVSSCGGSSQLANGEAVVYLTIEVKESNPDIDVCAQAGDIVIAKMSIRSSSVDPSANLTSAQDVRLNRWVITPYRTDGGRTASPEWSYDQTVFVAAGSQADLDNYRVYPLEFLSEIPLAYLFPENGGVDPETGNTNIRQSLELQIFG